MRLRWFVVVLMLLALWSPAQAQPVNWNHPSMRGLMAWYLGVPGYTRGPRWFEPIRGLHGTRVNDTVWGLSTRRDGKYEIQVDGTTDYITVAAHPALEPPVRTVTLWMKANAGGDAYQALVANQSDTNFFNILYRPSTQNNLAIYFKLSGGDNALDTGNAGSIVSGVWTHIAVIGGAGTVATYKNCILNESGSFAGTIVASNVATLFGAVGASPAQEFGGALDDIRIYNRILTPPEICEVMRQAPPLAPPLDLMAFVPPLLTRHRFFDFFPPLPQ